MEALRLRVTTACEYTGAALSGYNSAEMIKIIPFCALYLPYLVAAPALVAWYRCNALLRRSLLLRGITAIVAAVLVGKVFESGYYDVRPFARLHVAPLIYHQADNGFPLWPTALTATVAFVLMPYWRSAAYASLAVTVIVTWAQIASLLSSPVDAFGGLAVAAISALLARGLIRRAEKKRHLYPQNPGNGSGRGGGSGPNVSFPARPDGSAPELPEEAGASHASVTISEFDSRYILGYSDSIYRRN